MPNFITDNLPLPAPKSDTGDHGFDLSRTWTAGEINALRQYESDIRDVITGAAGSVNPSVLATGSTTPRKLSDRFSDVINVKDYGARGDGTTDDTAAIQAALNVAAGRIVIVPHGSLFALTSLAFPTGALLEDWSSGLPVLYSGLSNGAARYVAGYAYNLGGDNPGGRLQVYTEIAPGPATSQGFPLGHDLHLMAQGPADIYLDVKALDVTSTTSVAAPGTVTVTVNDTSQLSHNTNVILIADPGQANQENIANASWSIVDGTHLSVTFGKTHTQPFTLRQRGAVAILADDLTLSSGVTAGLFEIADAFNGTSSVPTIYMRSGGGAAFIAAADSSSARFYAGDAAGSHAFKFYSSSGSADKGSFSFIDNTGGSARLAFFIDTNAKTTTTYDKHIISAATFPDLAFTNGTNTSLLLRGQSDLARIFGGGTSGGMILYGSQGGTGTTGAIRVRDNQTDNNTTLVVTPGPAGTGSVQIQGGAAIKGHLSGTASWTPNIAAAAFGSTTVTVTGANVGDTVAVGFTQAPPAGVLLSGAVTATNTVTVTAMNHSASTWNPAAGTMRADVWQH